MYLCINFVNISMQNICAEMEKCFFFCISQIEATVLGNEKNFTHGNLKLLRETLVDVICGCTVCIYTDILCTADSVCTEDNLGVGLEKVGLTRNAS